MNTKFNKIFNNKKVAIGVIHFAPLLGYPDFPGEDVILENALKDLKSFENGGVDAIIIENNYDIPHQENTTPEIVDMMISLGKRIKQETKLPIGVNVLWNDYRAGLFIAKKIGAKFIRIPVFVDKVKTDCGVVTGDPKAVLEYQKEINAEDIALFTDIQVKHSELLNKRPIEESAKEAIERGSDALIVTGRWTGEAPDMKELSAVRTSIGDFHILIGSGADKENAKELLEYADGLIVSTSLKEGTPQKDEVNVKSFDQRIDTEKVEDLIQFLS